MYILKSTYLCGIFPNKYMRADMYCVCTCLYVCEYNNESCTCCIIYNVHIL